MCPPAASSSSFQELGPIVPSSARWVISSCKLPSVAVGGAVLVMVSSTPHLNRGHGSWFGESTGQWHGQRQRCGRLWCEGALSGFGSLVGQRTLAMAMTSVLFGHIGVVHGAVVPIVGVPPGQDAVSVVAVGVGSRASATPVSHFHAVETKPLRSRICAHHVAWTTPSDDNCRRAVDGT
jgi:hypothetical protein